jgi:predicted AlkP superfamily phosphohydrolase/phosphomutase
MTRYSKDKYSFIGFRCSDNLRALLKRLCSDEHISLAVAIRRAILEYIQNGVMDEYTQRRIKLEGVKTDAEFLDEEMKFLLSKAFFYSNIEQKVIQMIMKKTKREHILDYLDNAIEKSIKVYDGKDMTKRLINMKKTIEDDKRYDAFAQELNTFVDVRLSHAR